MLHEFLISCLVCVSLMGAMPAVSSDEMTDQARAGQDFAQGLLGTPPTLGFTPDGERDQGTVQIGDTQIPVNQLVPGGDHAEQQRLQDMEGDSDQLERAAQSRLVEQEQDPSDAAQALRESSTLAKPSPSEFMQAEGFLAQQSVQALTAPMSVAPEFPACASTTTVTGSTASYTTYSDRTCEIVHRPTTCTRTMALVDLSEQDKVLFDAHPAVSGPENFLVRVSDSFPDGTSIIALQSSIEWDGDVAAVRWSDPPTLENGWEGTLVVDPDAELCTTSCSVQIRVLASVRAVQQQFSSQPDGCLLDSDEFCQAAWTCRDDAPRTAGGLPILGVDAAGLQPLYPSNPISAPPSSLDPVCYQATADYRCRINTGEFCVDTPTGQHCTTNTDENVLVDTCAPMLLQQPTCAFLRSACTESGVGHNEFCYVESQVYRCPTEVTGPSVAVHTTNQCAGQIRCAGDDCLDRRFDEDGFSTVADGMAGMMVAQSYAADWQPLQDQRSTPPEPRLFPGKAYECRKALGGSISCCDETETDAEQKWFSKYQRHTRRANATESLSRYSNEGAHGSWKTLAESNQWSSEQLDRPLTSGPETITAGNNDDLDPDQGSVVGSTTLLQPMNEEFKEESRYDNMGDVGWACTAHEFDLANQREIGNCIAVGSYCHRSVLGACIDKRDVFCCFNSPATKAIREAIAGPNGVALGAFGTARDPHCEGVLAEQARVQQLDITDLKGRLAAAGVIPEADEVLARSSAERLTGSGSQLSDGARQTVQERTNMRLAQIRGSGVRDALYAEAAAAKPALEAVETRGQVSFAPSYTMATPGKPVLLGIQRQGTKGAASARVAGTLWDGSSTINTELHWSDGSDGLQTIRIDVPKTASGRIELQLVPDAGINAYPNDRAVIEVVR
ncbi:conjugal transfer protein TraN [Ahniella affigens]|nr:conjugal transfer protein TraN [Ahniella affigens]